MKQGHLICIGYVAAIFHLWKSNVVVVQFIFIIVITLCVRTLLNLNHCTFHSGARSVSPWRT